MNTSKNLRTAGSLGAALLLVAACSHDERPDPKVSSMLRTTTPGSSATAARSRQAAKREQKITVFADKNKDGKVTRDEAGVDPALERVFDQYDLDHNKELDRGEFARLERRARNSEFSRFENDDDFEAAELRRFGETGLDDSLEGRAERAANGDAEPVRPRDEYAHPA
jgi:hypothetical protein